MVKQIRVCDETFDHLVRLKAFMTLKTGEDLSMGDMVNILVDHFPKQRLNLEEGDIFIVEGPVEQPKQE